MMRAISIRQPWAWCILRPDVLDRAARAAMLAADIIKPVENRDWQTTYTGPLVIHASSNVDHMAFDFLAREFGMDLPTDFEMGYGGFVGFVDMVGCVDVHPSKWFKGPFGFVFESARPIKYQRGRGQLGLFPTAFSAASLNALALCP